MSRLFRYERIIWIAAIVFSLTISLGTVSFAEETTDYKDADGDYTSFAIEVSDMISDAQAPGETKEDSINKRLLVVGEKNLDLSQLSGSYDVVSSGDGLYVIQFETTEDAQNAYDKLQTLDAVLSVEFDALLEAERSSIAYKTNANQGHLSWGAECIGADNYSEYVKSHNHNDLVVAVVDTGVDSRHPFLSGRLIGGYNFVKGNDNTSDDEGHGTHVAGIIADCTLGVDDIKIMPVKSLDSEGTGTLTDLVNGLLYASDNGADVINYSVGGYHSFFMDIAARKVIENGTSLVVAAGNDGTDIDRHRCCPAHVEEVIVVGAINKRLLVDYYSNYGSTIDTVAPGTDINSTVLNGGYMRYSGTSMATPHVSACVAMMKLQYGKLSDTKLNSLLRRSCDKNTDVKKYGNGIINMNNLMAPISKQKIGVQKKTFVYTGKTIKPAVSVSRNNESLFKGSDYTVTYSNNKSVGRASAVIHGKGTYYGTKIVYYNIVPKSTSINKLSQAKKGFTVKWKKQASQTSGYEIQYSLKNNFKSKKSVFIKNNKITSKKIGGLKRHKKYYIRVRTYKTVEGKKYYSSWSGKKAIVTK